MTYWCIGVLRCFGLCKCLPLLIDRWMVFDCVCVCVCLETMCCCWSISDRLSVPLHRNTVTISLHGGLVMVSLHGGFYDVFAWWVLWYLCMVGFVISLHGGFYDIFAWWVLHHYVLLYQFANGRKWLFIHQTCIVPILLYITREAVKWLFLSIVCISIILGHY